MEVLLWSVVKTEKWGCPHRVIIMNQRPVDIVIVRVKNRSPGEVIIPFNHSLHASE